MENLNNLEQPEMQTVNNIDANEQIINEEKAVFDSSLQNGSNFGKFKDATSLLEAYNNLEKEFTKKSQKLSEVLKQSSENISQQNSTIEEKNPIFKNSNWQSEVSKFFEKNPEAKQYAKEISTTLLSDKDLSKHQNGLEYAYYIAKAKNQVDPASLINDPKYIEEVINNDNIKQKIISNYLQSINNTKTNIKFISGEANKISSISQDNKPKSIKEASNILKKLLQS